MAHKISIVEGIAEMAYLLSEGGCWHGIGQGIEDNATRETWMNAANISNWDILKCKSTFIDPSGMIRRVPGQIQMVRSDNFNHLGTVSEMFNVHQPQDVANWMFDAVDKMGFEMSTMGVLFNGKKFWCQANIKQSVNIGGIDRVNGKLLISVPNTGKEGSSFIYGTERVVCNNTLRSATKNGQSMLRVNHMNAFNPEEINDSLGLFDLNDWAQAAEQMTKIKMSETQVYDYLARVFDIYEEVESEEVDLVAAQEERIAIAADNRAVQTCYELFNGAGQGAELVTARGTLWGAVNSVTEYVDHKRNTRTWDARFDSAQFGRWAGVKDNAWDEAVKLAA